MLVSILCVTGALVGNVHRTPAATMSAAASPLVLVEHALPIGPAHRYEAALQEAMADRGDVLRWYIARIDEASGNAIAECVLLQRDAKKGRGGQVSMLADGPALAMPMSPKGRSRQISMLANGPALAMPKSRSGQVSMLADGPALVVPQSPEDMVAQAAAAVESAAKAGYKRLVVKLVIPTDPVYDNPEDLDPWPGGLKQQYPIALPLVRQMLQRAVLGGVGADGVRDQVVDAEDACGLLMVQAAAAIDDAVCVLFPGCDQVLPWTRALVAHVVSAHSASVRVPAATS